MFSIPKISSASESYYLSLDHYFLGKRSRKKAKKGRRLGEGQDERPEDDFDTAPDDAAITDADLYVIDTPGEPPGTWSGKGAAALDLVGMAREENYQLVFKRPT